MGYHTHILNTGGGDTTPTFRIHGGGVGLSHTHSEHRGGGHAHILNTGGGGG